jgi:hypothetical protein
MPIYHNFWSSNCTVLEVGCHLMTYTGSGVWMNADDDVNVVNGKFSDGTYCYTVVDGIITSKASCGYNLTVYAKYVSSSGDIAYDINDIPSGLSYPVNSVTCVFAYTITGLQSGDAVKFYNPFGFAVGGDPSDCPGSPSSCDYTVNMGAANQTVYLSVDGGTSC